MPENNDLILQELREIRSSLETRITDVKESLQDEIHSIRTEMLEFQLRANQLDELSNWARRFKETVTLAEIERLRQDVQQLKEFKAKSTVIFALIQFLMATAVAWITKG